MIGRAGVDRKLVVFRFGHRYVEVVKQELGIVQGGMVQWSFSASSISRCSNAEA